MTEQQVHSHVGGDSPLIELRNVTKSFKGFQAIKPPGIDLKIMPKEVLVIIGSSGSGKSTLLRCMNRLIEPTSGQVFFEGIEITPPNLDYLTREEIKKKKQKARAQWEENKEQKRQQKSKRKKEEQELRTEEWVRLKEEWKNLPPKERKEKTKAKKREDKKQKIERKKEEKRLQLLEGREIYDLKHDRINIDAIRQKIGMVFQQFNLFLHLTVKDNIRLPLEKVLHLPEEEIDKRIEEVLKTVNLYEKLNSYPGELSGGQQQRVAIARVLAMRPKMIFFDEPTSALDPELTGEVLNVMQRLVTEFHYTLVIVTHEIPFAKQMATRVIFMDEGEIIYRGSPKVVFENPPNDRLRQFLSKIIEMD
jgi:polar amino acid transport system ATP-binding protein